MKMKKISNGMKLSITILIIAMILVASIGVSMIFADPTIEDLVPTRNFGEFEPSALYSEDDHVALVGWLNVTQIIFSYDWWVDTSGDGEIDAEDVYTQEGFEQELLTGSHMLPIFTTENEDDDYYIVSFEDYKNYNGVVVQFGLAENNDFAMLKDEDLYWFDGENRLLYIAKTMLNDAFEAECFNTLRAETVMLTKDVRTATKTIDIMTLFAADIDDLHGLDSSTPNESVDCNMKECLLSGIKYQLVPNSKLAHVSSDDLTVYRNGIATEYTSWVYDETDGTMTIYCDPYTTNCIAVKFNDVHDATVSQQTLQHFQSNYSDKVGQATTLQQVLTGENPFLHKVTYKYAKPKVGTSQDLGFFAVVGVNSSGNMYPTSSGSWDDINKTGYSIARVNRSDGGESVSIDLVKDTIEDNMWRLTKVNGHFQSTTLAAWSDGGLKKDAYGNYYLAYDSEDGADGRGHSSRVYGEVVYNLLLARKYDNMGYLQTAMNIAEEKLFDYIDDHWNEYANTWGDHSSHSMDALTTSWDVFHPFVHESHDGRYITGTASPSFLGGTIEDGDGMALFDVICARITAPNSAWDCVSSSEYDYKTVATIVDVDEPSSNGDGYMYLCVYSKSVLDSSVVAHTQRVLAFSKVKYNYKGSGNLRLTKRDVETRDAISGAQYTIYTDANCTNVYATVDTGNTSVKSIDLPVGPNPNGTVYYVKETRAPIGYLLDDETVYGVTIKSGQTTDLVVYDERQECEFTVTVYDKSTQGNRNPHALSGISFDLYGPGGSYIGRYTTNEHGQLTDNGETTLSVDATGTYVLRQVDTIDGYCMTSQCNGGSELTINASPTNSERHVVHDPRKHIVHEPIVHYEHRQEVTIKSQVQDATLLSSTPADFDGDEAGNVCTTGSAYRLRAKSTLLLGYKDDGSQITIDEGELLTIHTQRSDGSLKNDSGEDNYSEIAYACAQGSKSYLLALGVQDPDTGLTYPLPNGYYQWELVDASKGYYDNQKETLISAPWTSDGSNVKSLVVSTPVEQVRQTAAITLYVKSYNHDGRAESQSPQTKPDSVIHTIKEDAYTSLLPRKNAVGDTWLKFINESLLKTVISNETHVDKDSIEEVTIKKNSDPVLVTVSSGVAPNAVYELVNLCDIITVGTGEKIVKGTVLGTYKSNADGIITIDTLGSNPFENPNKSTQSIVSTFKAVAPLTVNGNVAIGPLPNGIYGLSVVAPPDGYLDEGGTTEDIVVDARWSPDNSSNDIINISTATYFYRESTDPEVGLFDVNVAPDAPKVEDTDDYDPNNPNDDGNPDDSNDIPIASKDWVDQNKDGASYRIVDGTNITGENGAPVYEVKDQLPTTFSFYVNNSISLQNGYTYKYGIEFYYEVPYEEYNSADDTLRNNKEYIPVGDGKYARRFATDSISGGNWLHDVIVLNKTSPGYINYNEVKEDLVVAGAIHNTDWLNKKLSQQEDGDYSIYIVLRMTISYETKFSGQRVVLQPEKAYVGELKIKNRRLVNLD